jgi:hypothetical protein
MLGLVTPVMSSIAKAVATAFVLMDAAGRLRLMLIGIDFNFK